MEVVPFLEPGDKAASGLWYLISPDGDGPCPRVGHACLVLRKSISNEEDRPVAAGNRELKEPSPNGETVVIVAGATPCGPFQDVYTLELSSESFTWSKKDTKDLVPRYEHGILEDRKSNLYLFGGAQKDVNLNAVQMLKQGEKMWTTCEPAGTAPCPRTCLNVGIIDQKMYVFGGGRQGAQPVSDVQMHVFDADKCSWEQIETSGKGPTPRLGHLVVAYNKKIYIHGGMAGGDIYNDLFVLDTDTNKWEEIKQSGDVPTGRTAHAGVAVSGFIYIFGGMNFSGALSDLYKFDVELLLWTKIEIQGPPPPPRLDHTLCCVEIPFKANEDDGIEKQTNKQKIILSFGGMDTRGEIFNDLLAIAVQ